MEFIGKFLKFQRLGATSYGNPQEQNRYRKVLRRLKTDPEFGEFFASRNLTVDKSKVDPYSGMSLNEDVGFGIADNLREDAYSWMLKGERKYQPMLDIQPDKTNRKGSVLLGLLKKFPKSVDVAGLSNLNEGNTPLLETLPKMIAQGAKEDYGIENPEDFKLMLPSPATERLGEIYGRIYKRIEKGVKNHLGTKKNQLEESPYS